MVGQKLDQVTFSIKLSHIFRRKVPKNQKIQENADFHVEKKLPKKLIRKCPFKKSDECFVKFISFHKKSSNFWTYLNILPKTFFRFVKFFQWAFRGQKLDNFFHMGLTIFSAVVFIKINFLKLYFIFLWKKMEQCLFKIFSNQHWLEIMDFQMTFREKIV